MAAIQTDRRLMRRGFDGSVFSIHRLFGARSLNALLAGTKELFSGSASVSLAVFGLWPKTSPARENPSDGDSSVVGPLAGETPARATETVALPIPNDSLRLWRTGDVFP